ncbi:hypothetical protein [[Mycobacterium] crassicus]|uniref:Uncharacterized protein n=1 Tax=[Mycobacterium] crassicus TaxID=2872309 RepID=A0ABU5XMB5_9MYCO|nr:hypothetical protein [Mycolicibacter sp. MYC098]MEB3023323.1 hypothetical protein [Mycolicibacter sp. MYC098]
MFHNFNEEPIPFHADDQLRKVAEFGISMDADATPDTIQTLLAFVAKQLNRDAPTALWGKDRRYRRDHNLDVGDVVAIGDQAWAHEGTGWRRVTLLNDQIWVEVGRTRSGEPLLSRG